MSEYHQPVLLKECIDGLQIKPDGIYVDVTFGGGGHSKEILKHLENGKLIAFDQDENAARNAIDDERLIFVRHNFKYIKHFLMYLKIQKIDGLLADLGVSSHHFDSPDRGFSFRFEGELDMRMNQSSGLSAKEVINSYPKEDLRKIFRVYGEIKNADSLANKILQARENEEISNITQFLEVIKSCVPQKIENRYLAMVFQALRIEVNKELESLEQLMESVEDLLNPNGRLVIISYHSLEDRIVKNYIKSGNREGKVEKDFYGNSKTPYKQVNKKLILPTEEEIKENPRARSAKLRIAEKI
jgi:16S rRNA (cytosine1402-N4)-methyltransferase